MGALIVGELMTYYVEANSYDRIKVLKDLTGIVSAMSTNRLETLRSFAKQVAEIHDVDVIDTFLKWKDHDVLDTILLLTAHLEEDDQYEVLDCAETLAMNSVVKFG